MNSCKYFRLFKRKTSIKLLSDYAYLLENNINVLQKDQKSNIQNFLKLNEKLI